MTLLTLHRQHLRKSAAHRIPSKCNNCGFQEGLEGGIDRTQLILFKEYGITWERVFAILFPGYEPIPDKCEHPEPPFTCRTNQNTDFEELSRGTSMTPSTGHAELLQSIRANLREGADHASSNQYVENPVHAGRAQPKPGPYVEDESMLPHPNLPVWPLVQPPNHGTRPQANPQLRETSLLPSHIDSAQPSNIGAPPFPLDLAASTGNGSYDADFQNSQRSMSDFTGLTCHCLCHHHPQEPCFCFPDCSFYKAPTDALLG